MSTLPRRAFLALLLTATLSLGVSPSDTVGAQTFTEGISVMVVEIPVQVLRGGRPVRGLTAADFEVLDRGQPQEIVGFEVVDLTLVEGQARRPDAQTPVRAVATEEPTRGRQFLLLFDLDFLDNNDQFKMVRALNGARRMIEGQLHPLDRTAIGLYTGNSGAQVLVGFTTDREEAETGLSFVDALLDRDQKRAAQLLADLRQRRGADTDSVDAAVARLTRQFGSSAGLVLSAGDLPMASLQGYGQVVGGTGGGLTAGDEGGSDGLVDYITDMTDAALEPGLDRIRNLTEALGEMATLLRSVPEPKHLVYFSRGLPNAWIETTETRARAQNRLQPLVETMRAAGWRVQAIDVDGVPDALAATGRTAAGATSDPGEQLAQAGSDRFGLPPSGVGFEAQTLFQLAEDTGGQLFDNYNDFGQATADIIERSAVTYLLVIQPSVDRADGEYHPLTVRLREPSAKGRLLHRPGYFAPKPSTERTELEQRLDEADLVMGNREIGDLEVELMAYPTPVSTGGEALPLVVEVDGASLLAGADEAAQLSIQAYVLNDDGSIHDVLSQRLQLDLERLGPKLAEAPLRFVGTLRMPPGERRVRVLVKHQPSGREFLSTLSVAPGERGGDAPIVLPPLLLHPREFAPLTLQAPSSEEAAEAFTFGEIAVLPDLRPELLSGEGRHVLLTLFQTPGSSPGLSHRIVDSDGQAVEGAGLEWLQRHDAAGTELRLIGALETGDLAAGDYWLEVEISDRETGRTSVASSRFSVVAERPGA